MPGILSRPFCVVLSTGIAMPQRAVHFSTHLHHGAAAQVKMCAQGGATFPLVHSVAAVVLLPPILAEACASGLRKPRNPGLQHAKVHPTQHPELR